MSALYTVLYLWSKGNVALVDDDGIRLALAVMAERVRTRIVGVGTGRIANVEVE